VWLLIGLETRRQRPEAASSGRSKGAQGERILIHGGTGIGRTGIVAICVLERLGSRMKLQGLCAIRGLAGKFDPKEMGSGPCRTRRELTVLERSVTISQL